MHSDICSPVPFVKAARKFPEVQSTILNREQRDNHRLFAFLDTVFAAEDNSFSLAPLLNQSEKAPQLSLFNIGIF
jgi:hypothetical protein